MKHFLLAVVMTALVVVLAACGTTEKQTNKATSNEAPVVDYAKDVTENPVATITMENGDVMVVELQPKVAPNTVANFIALANDGFYDGLTFHRIIEGFMIQGGDPDGSGMGGPDYSINGEFTSNGFENTLQHTKGVISMARAGDPNSAGSQFFIMHEAASSLDGDYAAFGQVIEGLDVVDKIATVETGANDKPVEDVVMKSITVDTKGFDYPQPVKQ